MPGFVLQAFNALNRSWNKLATGCGGRLLLTGEFQLQLSLALLDDTVLLYHESELFDFSVPPLEKKTADTVPGALARLVDT